MGSTVVRSSREPQRYGVIEFDQQWRVVSIEEKPKEPKSNWAAIGLYFYDEHVADLVKTLKRCARSEYEITDLNNLYTHAGQLKVERIGGGFAWFDAGTHESLLEAAQFIRVLQSRQGQLIAAPEEIAYLNGWIGWDELNTLAKKREKERARSDRECRSLNSIFLSQVIIGGLTRQAPRAARWAAFPTILPTVEARGEFWPTGW